MTDTMFSTREVPWMKLGRLEQTVKTAAEAAELGGLNFSVSKRPLWFGDTDDSATAQPAQRVHERIAVVRDDTGLWLGIMSTDYPLLQFGEAFDFMDQVNPEFVAAGTLKGGKQGFMVVRGPELVVLSGDDPHELFIVFRTSHDGSRAIEVAAMPLRGRCMNQLTLNTFANGAKQRWVIKHTTDTSMKQKLADAHNSLKRLDEYTVGYRQVSEQLVNLKVSDEHAHWALETMLADRPKREQQITSIIDRWHTAETVGFDGTGWGLLNAVSDYFEWVRPGGNPESRFVGALQGSTFKAINGMAQYLLAA